MAVLCRTRAIFIRRPRMLYTHTTLFAIKGSNNKKKNKTKKKKRNKPLQNTQMKAYDIAELMYDKTKYIFILLC